MKLEDLYYFREAIKYQSISVAAEKNFISQSTVSIAIKRLEEDLGVDLVKRSSKGVSLTKIGKEVLDKADQVISGIEEIEQISENYEYKNIIDLSSSAAISEGLIPYCMQKIDNKAIPIKLNILIKEDYSVYRSVASGCTRLGIAIYNNTLLTGDLEFIPLFKDEYLVHIGPLSPLYDKEKVFLKDLMSHPYIAFGDEFLKEEANYWPECGFPNRSVFNYRCDSTGAIKKMILEGNYFCVLPKFNAECDLYVTSGKIRTKRIEDLPMPIQYGYIVNKRYKLGKEENFFLDKIKEVIIERGLKK